MKKKLCLVVLSHSSYKDMWDLTLPSYNKFFKCPIDLFITSDIDPTDDDKINLKNNNFKLLKYPSELSWSSALRYITNKNIFNNYNYVLFTFDDIVLTKNVSNSAIETCLKFMNENQLNSLTMNNSHRTIGSILRGYFNGKIAFNISKNDVYRGSLVFSCWDCSYFEKLINNPKFDNLSPWEYENNIKLFLRNENKIMAVYNAIFYYANILIRGVVLSSELEKAIKSLKGTNIKYSINRSKISGLRLLKYEIRKKTFALLRLLLPPKLFYSLHIINSKIKSLN